MATKVNFKTIKYSFSSVYFDASGLRLEAAEDLPEGSILKVDSTGKLALADASDEIAGVCRFPVASGGQAVAEPICVIENKGTTLGLTPGAAVYAGADGVIAGTGTVKVGVALAADKALIKV